MDHGVCEDNVQTKKFKVVTKTVVTQQLRNFYYVFCNKTTTHVVLRRHGLSDETYAIRITRAEEHI